MRVVPSQRRFTRVGAGHIAATRVGSRPVGRIERIVQVFKGTVLGSPIATARSIHERLTKIKALAILGSDPLSSSADATEGALPGFRAHHCWESLLHNQAIRRLRPFLDDDESDRILDFDYDVRPLDRSPPG